VSVSEITSIPEPAGSFTELTEREEAASLGVHASAASRSGADEAWSLRGQLTLANIVSTGSLLAGLAALLLAAGDGTPMSASRLRVVVMLIGVAALLDAIDGPLARMRHTAGPFGCNLDSLADMVSFGVVPAVALYGAQLHQVPVAGLLASAAFCVCGAWRLARFPLCQTAHQFVGCPVPLAAVIAGVTAVAFASTAATLATVASLSWLMIGTLAFPTWSRVLGRPQPPRRR
jgi:CDP-diacylglycerol---serine O-phosphatidyltransferase